MRGILYRQNGEKIFVKQVRYQPVHTGMGWVEQPARDFEDALLLIVRAFSSRLENFQTEMDAVTLTAQRSSVIPVDVRGKPLMPAMMWQDTRNHEVCEELEVYNETISSISGAKVNTVFSGSKMTWLRQKKPEVYNKVHKLVNIPEYLLHMMTGEYVTDYTYGSRSNLMNLQTCVWDQELLDLFQVKEEHLCRLIPPGTVCGRITKAFSKKSGLKEGLPVISAGGDQQCAAVGQGAFREGVASIVTGTGAFLVTTVDAVPEYRSGDIICNCSAVKGKYIVETNVLACCSAFDWFCRNFYDWEKVDYEMINRELEAMYSEDENCIVLPYFQGRSTPEWNANATAVFANITLGTKRKDILKAILEGIFMEINNNIQTLRQYADIHCAYISGGLTNSRVLNHMQADIYGMPLYHMEDSESTAAGALMVALKNLGIYQSYDEAFSMIRNPETAAKYEPKAERQKRYVDKQLYMNQLYDKIYK